jgi:hypothetical protein
MSISLAELAGVSRVLRAQKLHRYGQRLVNSIFMEGGGGRMGECHSEGIAVTASMRAVIDTRPPVLRASIANF